MNNETNDRDSREVRIQLSETATDAEENAPGRTAGKAEGSRETVEEDLAEKENATD